MYGHLTILRITIIFLKQHYCRRSDVLPGNEHFSISDLMAAMRGMAGSFGLNFPSAKMCATLTVGAVTGLCIGPALNGLINGDGVWLVQAPLGGSLFGDVTTLLRSAVFGLGRR